MPQPNDLSRSLVIFEQDATLIAVIEMGQSSWLDDRFHESCHNEGIHLVFPAPI
jgi:hypothetical protein